MIFKKVADLTIGSSTDVACTLLGYYNPGDGGGGELYWDPTSTQTPNNGTVFQVGTNSGRWIRVDQSKLYPEYFGAKGNDSLFDSQAFTTMFQISGHCVLMPNKTYSLLGNFTIDSRTLSLDGNGATLKADNSCNGVFITVNSSNNIENYATASYLFRNLNIIGPKPTNNDFPVTKEGTVGLYFYGIGAEFNNSQLLDNKLISSVTIKKFDVGIDIFSNVWCLSIDKCNIVNCCVAVNADKYKNDDQSIVIQGTNYGENIRFNSCNISNNQLGILNNGLYDLSFEGTSIDYNDCMVQVSEGRTKFINCYIERGNDQADLDYWIKMCGDGNWVKLFFENCEFVLANESINNYEIVYIKDNSVQPISVVIQRSNINIFNYNRSHFVHSPSLSSIAGGIMEGNFYSPGYDGDHTRDFIPSVYQNSLRSSDNDNDNNYPGWTFYTTNNLNVVAYWENNELILTPKLIGHKRFAYYDVNVFEEKTVSLSFFYQLRSNTTQYLSVKLQAIDEAENVIADLEKLPSIQFPLFSMIDTMSNLEVLPTPIPQINRSIQWGYSSKLPLMEFPISYTEGCKAKWKRVLIKHYSALPRGTRSIRLLFEGPEFNNENDICKVKNIELCLE